MACKTTVIYKRDGNDVESKLYPLIENILRTKYPHITMDTYNMLNPDNQIELDFPENYPDEVIEKVARYNYDKFHTPEFKEDFGDWINTPEEIGNRLHKDSLEPRLQYDSKIGKHFIRNKHMNKVYFPEGNGDLSSIYEDFADIKAGTKSLARAFYKANIDKDFRLHNNTWIGKSLLKNFIHARIVDRADLLINEAKLLDERDGEGAGDALYFAGTDLYMSLSYIDEWVNNVSDFFNQIGFKITDGEVSNESEELDNEENNTRSVVKFSSIEKGTKDKISANIKVMLSLVEDHKLVDQVFGEPRILDHDVVWNKVGKVLADVTPTLDKFNNIEDTFDLYYKKLEKLAVTLPYIRSLVDMINADTFTNSRKSEFVQAFRMATNDFIVDEVEIKTDAKGNNTVVLMEHKHVSDTNATYQSVMRDWYATYKAFLTEDGKLKKDEIIKIHKRLLELSKKVNDVLVTGELYDNSDYNTGLINDLAEIFFDLGISLSSDAFELYTGYRTETREHAEKKFSKLLRDTLRVVKSINSKDGINSLEKNPFKTQSVFKELAQAVALPMEIGTQPTLTTSKGQMWVYSYPTFVKETVNGWQQNREELVRRYNNEEDLQSSNIVKFLLAEDRPFHTEEAKLAESKKRIEKYKVHTFNVLQNKKTEEVNSDPVDVSTISKTDMLATTISKVLQFKIGKHVTSHNTLTPADNGRSLQIEHGYSIQTNARKVNGKIVVNNTVVNIMFDYFKADYNRMIRNFKLVQSGTSDLKMYSHLKPVKTENGIEYLPYDKGVLVGNAFKSQYFPSLSFDRITEVPGLENSNIFDPVSGAPLLDSLDKYEGAIRAHIKDVLSNRIENTINTLEALEFFKESLEGSKNNYFDSRIFNKYAADNKLQPQIPLIADFFVNSLINNIEYGKMFTGESYHYKNDADYTKRIPATYTDGMYLRLESNDDLYFKAAIIENVMMPSQFLDKIRKSYGDEIADKYANIDSTDAQAWITPNRWKFLMQRLGLWHDIDHQVVYDKMTGKNKEPLTPIQRKLAAQPLKGVYFKSNNGVPTYLKYSQAVIYPELVKGTGLQRLLNKMESKNIDEVVTVSAIKVGSNKPNKIHNADGSIMDEINLDSTLTLDNRGWKLQQNLPVKNIKNTLIGSQIQKNILMGLHDLNDKTFILNGKETSRDDIYEGLLDIIGAMSDKGLTKILTDFGIDEDYKITNPSKLYSKLIEEAKKRNVDKNLIRALEKEVSILGIPQSYKKFINMFASAVNTSVVRIKTDGASFIQIADFGFADLNGDQQSNIKWLVEDRKLRPPLLTDTQITLADGSVKMVKRAKPGQILIPASYINQLLPEGEDVSNMSVEDIKEMIDSEAFKNIIGYRIPNQALASNDALEIVGILPETVGDSVVAYTEIPVKTGSDFDIDKMYMMLPSLKYNDGKIQYVKPSTDEDGNVLPIDLQPQAVLNNMLIEHYKAVLTHPEVAKQVMTPIDFEHVSEHIKYLFPLKEYGDLELMSPLTQLDIKYAFLAGKAGVGQTANMLVDHARGLFVDNYFNKYDMGWGHKFNGDTVLDRTYSEALSAKDLKYIKGQKTKLKDIKSKYKISDTLSAFLNAFVDIAKDPYVTRGNWATQTSNVGFTMIRAGVHPFIVNSFIGQPVIKRYIDFIVNNESKLAHNQKNMVNEFKKSLFQEELAKQDSFIVGDRTVTYTTLAKSVHGGTTESIISNYSKKYKVDSNTKGIDDLRNAIDYIKGLQETMDDRDSVDITSLSLQELEGQIKSEFIDIPFQLAVFNKFREVLQASKEVVNNMKIMKVDTEGFGKDLSSKFRKENMLKMMTFNEETDVEGSLMNIKHKLRDPNNGKLTGVGTYHKNSIFTIDKILKANPSMFLLSAKEVERTFNLISYRIYNQPLVNEELADKIYNSFYSYMFSHFDALKNDNYVEDLFTNLGTEVKEQLAVYQEAGQKNYLLEIMEVVEDSGYNFLKINNATKTSETKNNIYRGWLNLMRDNKPLSIKLAQYAYYQSGFEININEFYSSIPHEIMVENNVEKFVRKMSFETDHLMHSFVDQFFQHRHNDAAIVKRIFSNKIAKRIKNNNGFVMASDTTVSGRPLEPTQKPYYVKVDKSEQLYKLIGYNASKQAIYFKTGKKGIQTNNGRIYEYTFGETKDSQIKENQLKNKVDVEKAINEVTIAAVKYTPDYFIESKELESDLTKENEIIEDTVTNVQNESTPYDITTFTNHSGGAIGSDTQWDIIGKEFGMVNNNHYWTESKTPTGNVEISKEDFEEGKFESAKAAKRNWGYQYSAMKDSRLIRNWSQVKHSDAIFAIGYIIEKGGKMFPHQRTDTRKAITPSVGGGTGYAVGMAINNNKPVYIFNQEKTNGYEIGWYKWDNNDFIKIKTPKLTKDFAGIGTRKINEIGKQAIRDVYTKTVANMENASKKKIVKGSNKPETSDEYQYYGKKYVMILNELNEVIDVLGYNGKNIKKQKIVDAYNINPNIDIQNNKHFRSVDFSTGSSVDNEMNKYELFPNVYANEEQKIAIDKMMDFIKPFNKEKTFTLTGKGGTGKTTIIKKVTNGYKGSILYVAPTHKAKMILSKSTNSQAMTLASSLFIKLNETTGNFEADTYRRSKNTMPVQKNNLIIIDEASMINDKLLKELNKFAANKIIFMGDNHQLAPIGQETDSKVFDYKGVNLTKRMRQGEESPIIPVTDAVADNVEKGVNAIESPITNRETRLNIKENEGVLFAKNSREFVDNFIKDYKEDPTSTKIITFNNQNHNSPQSVGNMNKVIRKELYGEKSPEFIEGEQLMAYNSITDENNLEIIINSMDYTISNVSKPKITSFIVSAQSKAKGNRSITLKLESVYATIYENNDDIKNEKNINLLTKK
jgi:hypothetical protein